MTRVVAAILGFSFLFPTVFLSMPRVASAGQGPGCVVGVTAGLLGVKINSKFAVNTSSTPGDSGSVTTSGATVGECIYNTIVVPVLRQMIRNFLQQITQRAVDWISGNNSTGRPSYVQNINLNIQGLEDAIAGPVISQFSSAFNSPFGPMIASAIYDNYTHRSNMAGFYAANQCTLPASSPNVSAFLAGDWSQGGAAAWLSLTTQSKNNPYTLYQRAESQLGAVLANATSNRRQELAWGKGFLSWCSPTDSSFVGPPSPTGVNPGDSCTNSDGSSGTVETPGTTIEAYLNKSLGSGIDNLVSAQDLDAAIGAIASALADRVVGETGLFGSSSSGGGGGGGLGPPPGGQQSTAAADGSQLAQDKLSDIAAYRQALQTIINAAGAARGALSALPSACSAQAAEAGASAALSSISQIISERQALLNTLAATTAVANQVIAAANVVPLADPVQFANLVSQLASLPPFPSDVALAQIDAQSGGGSTAIPDGSFNVFGGSIVDQMNLISSNASTFAQTCTQ